MSTILLWLLKEVPCFRRRPSPNRHPPHSQITDLNTGADGFLFKTRVEKNTNHLALENPHSSARRFPLPSLKTISTLTPPIPISNYELCGAGFSPSLRSLPPAFFSNRTWANWRQKALSQARRAWSGVTRGALHLPVGGRRAFFSPSSNALHKSFSALFTCSIGIVGARYNGRPHGNAVSQDARRHTRNI